MRLALVCELAMEIWKEEIIWEYEVSVKEEKKRIWDPYKTRKNTSKLKMESKLTTVKH